MAEITNVFLGAGNTAPGFDNAAYFGNSGSERVTIGAGVDATAIDQNIEAVTFVGNPEAYKFQQAGNTLRVFSGTTLVTTIIIQDDANGTQLTFDGGTATAKLTAGVLGLNGITVPSSAPGAVVIPGVTPTPASGETFYLEVTTDRLTGADGGTEDDDVYVADIISNSLGEQTNSLGTGDRIDGNGGTDTLLAHVQDASPLNAGPTSSINPITVDVEVAHFYAEANYEVSDVDPDTYLGVEINAARMLGLDEVGSVQSDSSLTIYNLTTLTDSGAYNDRRVTESITVRMDHTGNDSAVLPEANLTVLFDQDYLLAAPPGEADSSLTLQMLDIDNEILTQQPLKTNPYDTLVFGITVDGIRTEVPLAFNSKSMLTGIAAYQELANNINLSLQARGLTDLVAVVTTPFQAEDPDDTPVVNGVADGYNIVITNMGEGTLDAVGFIASGIIPPNTDYQKEVFPTPPSETPEFITVDIDLEKVGKGADGGVLTVGGMGTDLDNVLVGRDDLLGVEQFDVTVSGDDTQDSSLAALQSTTNTLRFVYVESAAGTDAENAADLIIGNSNTVNGENGPLFGIGGAPFNPFDVTTVRNNGLKDVLIFDTTGANSQGVGAFLGDVTLHAYFSEELREKYLDQTDTDPDHQADDMDALYTTGVGDDTINLAINELNFASQGTVTRDDFSISVFTNEGNDHVQFQIGDGDGLDDAADDDDLPNVDNWYHNHVLSDNVTIVTGSGDDFVESYGSSAARISLGTGNDLVYTDNSGDIQGVKPDFEFTDDIAQAYHATWVYNAQNDELVSLESEGPLNFTTVGNVTVTVVYEQIEASFNIASTFGTFGATISDLDINQAIKAIINTPGSQFDGLLVAEDGPARTLLVRSETDGERYIEDLQVSITSTALTPQQIAAGTDTIQSTGGFGTLTGRYAPDFADFFGVEMSGDNSDVINNDRVNGGLGNDTIVLSSNEDSVEHVEITGLFDSDIILNFEAAVETATESEVQTVTFGGGNAVGAGTIVLSVFGVEPINVAFVAGQTPAQIAANAATAIDAALEAAYPGADFTATVVGGVVTVEAAPGDGTDYADAEAPVIVGGGTPETQVVAFDGTLSAGQIITVSFGSLGSAQYTVPTPIGGATIDTLLAALEVDFENNAGVTGANVVIDTAADTITLVNNAGGDVAPATVTIQTSGTNLLEVEVTTTTDGTGAGFTSSVSNDVDGDVAQLAGWDIFDLSVVLDQGYSDLSAFNGDVTNASAFGNNIVEDFNNNIVDGAEKAEMAALDLSERNVLIIDQFTAQDFGAGAATTEAQRIEDYLNSVDVAGANTAERSVIITIDETDTNLGRFYQVVNGNGKGDVDVTYLGSVEFGDHDDVPGGNANLDNIGEWGLLTEINFEPMTNAQLASTTFTV
jgi:hypothetical protein